MSKQQTQPSVDPTLVGSHAKAWRVPIYREKESEGSSVDRWVIYQPGVNAFWSFYMVEVIHLRPIEGLGDARILLPGASHEVMVFALDPERDIYDCWKNNLPILVPPNYTGQFFAESDEYAKERVERAVIDITNGLLTADSDSIQGWIDRFGTSNIK